MFIKESSHPSLSIFRTGAAVGDPYRHGNLVEAPLVPDDPDFEDELPPLLPSTPSDDGADGDTIDHTDVRLVGAAQMRIHPVWHAHEHSWDWRTITYYNICQYMYVDAQYAQPAIESVCPHGLWM